MGPAHDESRNRAEARRDRLCVLMDGLSDAIDVPDDDPVAWRLGMAGIAEELLVGLDDHIAETEGPEGFLAEITANAPRLTSRLDVLSDQHPQLRGQTLELQDASSADSPATIAAVRQRAVTLLASLNHHHELGGDILYRAYWIDVAAGD